MKISDKEKKDLEKIFQLPWEEINKMDEDEMIEHMQKLNKDRKTINAKDKENKEF